MDFLPPLNRDAAIVGDVKRGQRLVQAGGVIQPEVVQVSRDFFAHKASSYEQNKSRVDNVGNIANSVINSTVLSKQMKLMDFGSGTGLLLERVAPYVGKIEDGSFHTEDTGVYHFGFDRAAIANIAKVVGFQEVTVINASVVHKPQGDFGVFLLKAKK